MFCSGWLAAWRRSFGLARRATRRPGCEPLEDRSTPAAFTFSTGAPDGAMAMLSRPGPTSGPALATETADDFLLSVETLVSQASFTGLVPANTPASAVSQVVVEIYRVFPNDSDPARSPAVPSRDQSPADTAFLTRDSASNGLTFQPIILAPTFPAANAVINNINPAPNQTTGGEGGVTGEAMTFTVTFAAPLDLPPDHYFFVPQVKLTNGNFLWLSAQKPANGALFPGDQQTWVRNAGLSPDWLRVGTDVVGGTAPPTFNASFGLTGQTLAPTITGLSKTAGIEGAPTFALTVTGSNFTSASQVVFGGTALATTFVSAGQLTTTVPASLLADEGIFGVSVTDPTRGTSDPVAFTVADAAPAVAVTRSSLSADGKRARVGGKFGDVTSEGHRVRIAWGDGKISVLDQGVSSGGSFSASHTYNKRRNRVTVRVTVLDDEGTASSPVTLRLTAAKKHAVAG
jgi:IPT/TIG domain